MNKTNTVLTALVLAVSSSGAAHAQSSASATAIGSTTIVQPVSITKTADLAFGRLVRPTSDPVMVVLFNGMDLVDEDDGLVALDDGAVSRAKFTITGEGGQAVSVSVPSSLTMTSGASSIVVSLEPDTGTVISLSGAAGSAGTASLNIGAGFMLSSTQPTGSYSGSFTVTVAYQ